MKKLWKYRFYILTIIGFTLMLFNIQNAESNTKLMLWTIGMICAFLGVTLQLIIAPNYKPNNIENNLRCPDCGADLKLEKNKLKFVKHN